MTEKKKLTKKAIRAHQRKIRDELMEEQDRKCKRCERDIAIGDPFYAGSAALHHRHYRSVGQEKKEDVVLLCSKCHRDLHYRCKRRDLNRDDIPYVDPEWEQSLIHEYDRYAIIKCITPLPMEERLKLSGIITAIGEIAERSENKNAMADEVILYMWSIVKKPAEQEEIIADLLEACELAEGFLKNQGYSEHDPFVRGAIRTAIAKARDTLTA